MFYPAADAAGSARAEYLSPRLLPELRARRPRNWSATPAPESRTAPAIPAAAAATDTPPAQIPRHRRREVMVSVFYPAADAAGSARAEYLSPRLLPELRARFGIPVPELLTNSVVDAPAAAGRGYPVVLYSPGGGMPRVLGTGLAEELASHGYVVVTVDDTYEAMPGVEFPGGRFVRPAPVADGAQAAMAQKYVDVRVDDLRFVLDALARVAAGGDPDAEGRSVPRGLGAALDLARVGVVGHSCGGYAAVEALREDRRVAAAVDLDGQLGVGADIGRAAADGVDRPVLVMTSAQADRVGDADVSLDAFWRHGTGWKRQLGMRDSAHYDYTDVPLLVPDPARPAAALLIGPIAAARSTALVRTYVLAMFEAFLRGRAQPVLDRPVDAEIIRQR
ncbi:alpha/beta hydrolase family protein [Nocardia terpenica]|nr:hypothetical protein [Nocardia terpenica]